MIQLTDILPTSLWRALRLSYEKSSVVGVLLVRRLMISIKFSSATILLKNIETDGKQSFACFQKMYNRKSKIRIQGNELIFYSLHFTKLNLTGQCRRRQIVMKNTVLALLPTAYSLPDENKEPELYQQVPFINVLKRYLNIFDAILLQGCL